MKNENKKRVEDFVAAKTNRIRKMTPLEIILLSIFTSAAIAVFFFKEQIYGDASIFYEGSANYAFAGLHSSLQVIMQKVPAMITTVIIIDISALLIAFIRFISRLAFKGKKRALTIVSLLNSLCKWIVAIIAILLILSSFGVDTATLLASAGILTLVIGLGAQSIVADILAGFFLVFEGEYDVGDIISIDGWRGTVLDIGIRVTRLIDAGGNIKTINNSDVKNVVNQTSELSVAKVVLAIDYGESLERVELVLKDSFDGIAKRIPQIVEGPVYKGVSELGQSSVNLLIIAKCKEEDIYQVQRDLIREFYLVFNKNNITVPFNQIVVSERDEEERKVTKKQSKEANDFVDEQKGLNEDIVSNYSENK